VVDSKRRESIIILYERRISLSSNNKVSDQIKVFTDLLIKTKQDYEYAMSMVSQLDKEFDLDIGHEFELSPAKDKNKIATKARINRLDRRYYKNKAEEYEPIYKLITDPQNKKAFDQLTQVLGKVRKAESYHTERTYYPRVTKQNEIKKKIIA
jgi:hypothetical protein